MMAQENILLAEKLIQKCPDCKFLTTERFVPDVGNLFHFVIRCVREKFSQLLFGLGHFPDRDSCFVVEFFLEI